MDTKPPIRNPYRRGAIPLIGLTVLFLTITLLIYGLNQVALTESVWSIIGLIFTLIFGLITVIIEIIGALQVRRIKNFLASERPLVRWTYSSAEWTQIKDIIWQDQRNDWTIQFGCLTALLALAGLLSGLMVGAEDGFIPALSGGFIGLLAGALAGGIIGALVAGGNHLAAILVRRDDKPQIVALGVNEIYANGQYFKGDGVRSYIQAGNLLRGTPTLLEIQIKMPPRVRMPEEETWQIPVSSAWIQKVEEIIPLLASK